MKNKLLTLICTSLIATGSLTGCQSTTSGGATGSNRTQLIIPDPQLNAEMAAEYKNIIAAARKAGALDKPSIYAKRVKNIFNRLVPHTTEFRSDGTAFNWEIHTIDTNEINAWCMPGGKMVVYNGIIRELNLTNDELAAIIGHEMAHALREHSQEQITQEKLKNTGFALAGQFTGLNTTQINWAQRLTTLGVMLPFSRKMESESDVIGLELMARAGYNPEAAVTLWEKMGKKSGDKAFAGLTSTHPTSSARINELRSRLPQVMPLYEAAKKGKKK